jgi:hypothetical protein
VRRPDWDGRITVTLTSGGRSVGHHIDDQLAVLLAETGLRPDGRGALHDQRLARRALMH